MLRLMRDATLLAPHRNKRVLGPYIHDGSALHEWAKLYNEQWLIERHGVITPLQARRALEAEEAKAA